ncbi:hypothetical protein [Fischerella thermalis]|jgi:hypothetical protein|uniref:Uncharacterized protein n=1 Tax=Fischerella thermalis JSC-11 TaxID=741277 RepID=G6FP74_9CYAN|nr:hypothetical protein [Fischerella thermalis]PLZ80970.1 hypothetical protein CBP16_11425 [Fischerella thermalis WC217]PMB05097.1 hypothetical protein CEN49_19105 [Fischerella thermalis CCMEE 5273]PMB12091.1 hypothetical protein CI592_02905 [Fischerella thermalis CCMEE 5328]EHC18674.1 hypothetical protein FJSC11DRAFT_0654 [Fischerella thermalis JSC-11]MBF1990910.1 hypothetical protein [Fischerella thermalis M58_A2018_009]
MSTSGISERESHATWAKKLEKCFNQVDQQVKFMHLQAEVDCLLQQLQHLKMQKLAAIDKEE